MLPFGTWSFIELTVWRKWQSSFLLDICWRNVPFVAIKTCGVRQIFLHYRFVVVLWFPVVVLNTWFLLSCLKFLLSIPVRFVVPKVSPVLRRRCGLIVIFISRITIRFSLLFHSWTIVIPDNKIYHLLPFHLWMDMQCDHWVQFHIHGCFELIIYLCCT